MLRSGMIPWDMSAAAIEGPGLRILRGMVQFVSEAWIRVKPWKRGIAGG
jgi:hypothetical protein